MWLHLISRRLRPFAAILPVMSAPLGSFTTESVHSTFCGKDFLVLNSNLEFVILSVPFVNFERSPARLTFPEISRSRGFKLVSVVSFAKAAFIVKGVEPVCDILIGSVDSVEVAKTTTFEDEPMISGCFAKSAFSVVTVIPSSRVMC